MEAHGAQVRHFRPDHIERTGAGDVVIVEEEDDFGPTLGEELGQLADEAKAYAQAEIAFQKSRAAYAAGQGRSILVLGVLAAAFAFFALMALVVGLLIALGPLLTPWGAMAAVTAVLLLASFLCVRSVMTRVKRIISLTTAPGASA